ncbi:MAG TPA: hypothetical protein VI894_02425 [Candidatus Nanoarchaeia archaeon]|nr:hypothetical protein [Candidatus Nanoarchaeia archaeon]
MKKKGEAVSFIRFKDKKSQATVFIILGLIILIIGGSVFYLRSASIKKLEKQAVEIPLEVQPVNTYVTECINRVAVEGLKLIGARGGYIDFEKRALKVNPVNPTENSDGVAFMSNVAYWWFLKSPNACSGNCEFASNMPALYKSQGEPSIEGQLDSYINENLNNCLADFSTLKAQGYRIEVSGSPSADSAVTKEDVAITVSYEIGFSKQSKGKLEKFSTTIPVNLKEIYDIAQNITSLEAGNDTKFLEGMTMNLISGFSGVKQDKLPSISDLEFSSTGTIWTEQSVRKNFEGMLSAYVPILQLQGSANYQIIATDSQLAQQIYDNFVIPSEKIPAKHDKYVVEFDYPNTPIYLDINCRKGICQPEQIFTTFPIPFGMQKYSFSYDVSYPAIVTITDPTALNGRGYVFRFALESNIRNNEPLKSDFTSLEFVAPDRSLFCDPDKRNSGNVTIKVSDGLTKNPMQDAVVTFSCGSESCATGATNESGILNTRLPICLNGILGINKLDYSGYSARITTVLDKEEKFSIALEPYRYKNITIMKKKISKTDKGWLLFDDTYPLDEDEQVFVTFDRNGADGEEEYSTIINLFGGQNRTEVQLLPGIYNVSANLILYKDIVIPEETRKFCSVNILGICIREETIIIPSVIFEQTFPEGGIELNNETALNLNVKLDESDEIILYLLAVDIPGVPEESRKVEDLEQLNRISEYSKQYYDAIKPKFK